MTFSTAELVYLKSQRLGRLATQQANGTLQLSPVGFRLDEASGTIDIPDTSCRPARSSATSSTTPQWRSSSMTSPRSDPWRVRCLEIRGSAEAIPPTHPATPGDDDAMIRIHPSRVISFGLEDSGDPHEMLEKMRSGR